MAERIFEPFVRGGSEPEREGLGLGLYIASEIARVHGAALSVESLDRRVVFKFQMPLKLA